MTEIQQNRWDQLLRRSAGLIGPGSKVNDALSELFPVMEVERVTSENLKLVGWNTCVGSSDITAAVAQFASVQLFNPAGSGSIIVCDHFVVTVPTSQKIRWNNNTTAFGTHTNSQRFIDDRNCFLVKPLGELRAISSAGALTPGGDVRIFADTPFDIQDPNGVSVLAPGSGLNVGGSVTNDTLTVTYFWRERPALAEELNF